MKKFFLIACLIILSISCSEHKSQKIILQSEYIPTADTILVFTPNNYKKEKKYPLVILLHGWSGNYNQWNSISNLQMYADAYNFIIACPDGFYDSWYLNNPLKKNVQWEDFFKKDFIPHLKSNFSLDTNNFFITGLSMGGHGAITLFLKNKDLFKSAGSTSGILDLTFFPERWSIKEGIGSIINFPKIWNNNSAFYLLDSLKNFNKQLIIDCGTEDFAYEVNLNFVKKCYDLGISTKFISIPGEHSGEHWKKMIAKHFEFFNNQINISISSD